MNKVKITPPDGYEVDKEKSTFEQEDKLAPSPVTLSHYEPKWYDVREVIPDESFGGVEVAILIEVPYTLRSNVIRVGSAKWDHVNEGFYPDLVFNSPDSFLDTVHYWCPLPPLPSTPKK